MSNIEIIFLNESQRRIPRQFLQQVLSQIQKMLRKKKIAKIESFQHMVIVFQSQARAKKTNQQFRFKNYATDVLSFVSDDPESLGELVLCPEVIEKQAKEHGLSFRAELAYLVLHGVLHLLGFEHEGSKKQAAEMFRIQDEIFFALKLDLN